MIFRKIITFLTVMSGVVFAQMQFVAEQPTNAPVENETAPVMVVAKPPRQIQFWLDELKSFVQVEKSVKPQIDELLADAKLIAEEADRCNAVPVNGTLDSGCVRLYVDAVPTLERGFLDVAGKALLDPISILPNVKPSDSLLNKCAEALTDVLLPREELLRLTGDVRLMPVNVRGDLEAQYKYTLAFNPELVDEQLRLANLWLAKCGEVVGDQSEGEFVPKFKESLKSRMDVLQKAGFSLEIELDEENLAVRVGSTPLNGLYFLNGVKVLSKNIAFERGKTHLLLDVKNKNASFEMGKDDVVAEFNGQVNFDENSKKNLVGRWMWNAKNADLSINLKNSGNRQASADAAMPQNERYKQGAVIHWVPLAISGAVLLGGTIMGLVFNSKASSELDSFNKEINQDNISNYSKRHDDMEHYQSMRSIGICIAVAGLVGVGVTLAF
ncbi:MAG: hypothetical protein MJY82_03160 [Fibrobacter sp.]|nr:hypothetical protein [Fibrobacter sp.]